MDTVLSEEGIKQTQLVGIKLQDENFSHVFSSDLTRARKVSNDYSQLSFSLSEYQAFLRGGGKVRGGGEVRRRRPDTEPF